MEINIISGPFKRASVLPNLEGISVNTEFGYVKYLALSWRSVRTVGHKSHDPCFHKKHIEIGVMNFVARCTFSCWIFHLCD